jgi:5-oxoprolinase (ATP-hydrolysing)
LIQALIQEYALPEVHKYMFAIQSNAEQAVRSLLKKMRASMSASGLKAVDYMDDGTPIALSIEIDDEGSAVFDFAGTGAQVYANTNAPRAITHSAIIYCLRSLVASDMPLNQGCLNPIEVRIPESSILSPNLAASVVGGNVLTSQRITDVILTAFGACADSSGCMNNLTFGIGGKRVDEHGNEVVDKGFGYYETIGGGAGAGPTWDGTSGVHTHMTNTRITDPEVFEKRYPVLLREFGIRPGSGGEGQHPGGDGIVRDIEFLTPGVQVSILSERRARAPKGAAGGGAGAMGQNLWVRSDGSVVNLGGKATASFDRGDRIIIKTPGGGAWGEK